MNKQQPDHEQIKHWIDTSRRQKKRSDDAVKDGYYERKGISMQSVYAGDAMLTQSLARALFLRGDSIGEVRGIFSEAGEYQIRNFSIAYDKNDPEYAGDSRDLSTLIETEFFGGMNSFLMGCNFERAKYLAALYQTSPDGDVLSARANRYAHAFKHCVLGDFKQARQYRDAQFEEYKNKIPKSGAGLSYYTLHLALSGIIDKNEAVFNDGLQQQVDFYYKHLATKEYRNTSYRFVCDDCVALANLGIHHGLNVTVEHHLIPEGLLLEK